MLTREMLSSSCSSPQFTLDNVSRLKRTCKENGSGSSKSLHGNSLVEDLLEHLSAHEFGTMWHPGGV